MTRNTKIYFLTLFIFISATIGYALATKHSFTGEYHLRQIKKQYHLDHFIYSDDEDSLYFDDSINTLDELEIHSDLIVKVQSFNNSELFLNSVKTPVKILDIYKTKDHLEKGDLIYIQEPVSISYQKGMENMTSIRGYVLMNDHQEYLLFLKHLDKVKGYKYKKSEEMTYIPVSTRFSKYCKEESPLFIDSKRIEEGEIHYRDFKDASAIFIKSDELKQYQSISSQVYDKYQ